MQKKILDVYLHHRLAGQLEQNLAGKLLFTYDPAYVEAQYPVLSVSLPLQTETYSGQKVQAFFSGLLPDEMIRVRVARYLGVSEKNPFALLKAIGLECAGAVSLHPHGQIADSLYPDELDIIDENKIHELIDLIANKPLLVGTEGIQLSLAGAQNKMGVRLVNNKIALAKGSLPTTHILKPIIAHVENSVQNEYFCMRLAKRCGLEVPEVEIRFTDTVPYYLVERYDRYKDDQGQIHRLHQEDFCQALAIVPENKYENEGGPSFQKCLELLKEYSKQPGIDQAKILKIFIFNYLIGNADAHGKNYSFLYLEERPILAPAYDLLSTAVYPNISKKMAMKIGGKYLPSEVALRHWHRIVPDTALARTNLNKLLKKMSIDCLDQAYALKDELLREGLDSKMYEQICEVIKLRGEKVRIMLGEY